MDFGIFKSIRAGDFFLHIYLKKLSLDLCLSKLVRAGICFYISKSENLYERALFFNSQIFSEKNLYERALFLNSQMDQCAHSICRAGDQSVEQKRSLFRAHSGEFFPFKPTSSIMTSILACSQQIAASRPGAQISHPLGEQICANPHQTPTIVPHVPR